MAEREGTITILLVEDDADLSSLMKELLEEEGYRVAVARSGRAAFEWLRGNVPSLIVLDLLLPDVTGLEFEERRHRDPLLSSLPVIVTTGLPPAASKTVAAVATLSKPYRIDDLLTAVRENVPSGAECRAGVDMRV